MDNGTIVEAFKYLNYCQLAKNSLVSMKFHNVIQTHRHKLALLYVRRIKIKSVAAVPNVIKVFDKQLSSEEYNDWESKQNIPNGYYLNADAYYKDSNHRDWNERTNVYFAHAELNHENWPVFQHFVRLAADPFIYIERMKLTYQNVVLNSLSGAANLNLLQCKELYFVHNGNTQEFLTWTKNYMHCNQLLICGEVYSDQNEALLDFFMTGGHCTSMFGVILCAKSVVVFVQKFIDLKQSDEIQLVDVIEGYFDSEAIVLLKRNYAKFAVKDERDEDGTVQIFEFANKEIGKNLQLTATEYDGYVPYCSIKVNNL